MVDTLSPERRSENMRRIRSKGMKPEMVVRSMVHRLGYRFRLHHPGLPGKPDLVFPGRRKVIFVHGCFWHQHEAKRCKITRKPKSNKSYWNQKLERNRLRDARNARALRRAGWGVMTIWECALKHEDRLARRIIRFLDGP